MPLVINTNVSSLNAQRQLVNSGSDLSTAMERLSSGRRINSAADDAAGLAISNRMTSQIRGLTQAVRNGNDGISMIQTAEGALDETTNILQRIRELAIQAANGIYSDSDRSTLDAEVQQLKSELDRIANTTTFNGQLLLDGSLGEVKLQVGALEGQTITMRIPAMDVKTLGGSAGGDVVGTTMTVPPEGVTAIDGSLNNSLFINGQNVGNLVGATNMQELLTLFNENVSGVTTTAFTEVIATESGSGILRGADMMVLDVFQNDGTTNTYQIGNTGSMEELAQRITDVTGGVVRGQVNENGRLMMTNSEGAAIHVSYLNNASVSNTGIAASGTVGSPREEAYQANLSFTSDDGSGITIAYDAAVAASALELGLNARNSIGDITGLTATVGDIGEGELIINGVSLEAIVAGNTATEQAENVVAAINAKSSEHGVVADNTGDVITLNSIDNSEVSIKYGDGANATDLLARTGLLETNVASSIGNSVADISIDTIEGASAALSVVDAALETINDTRAQMGAVANRLEFTISNITNVVEKTEASRSRIMDADFAAESAALSRAQVLQQASQAMLAQANAQPQQVLQLLQG